MQKIEYLLAGLFLISIVGRDSIPLAKLDVMISICGAVLGLFYLIGFWWLHKPSVVNFRTITISILYGLVCFLWSFTILYQTLFLTGAAEMMMLASMITVFVVVLDLMTSIGKIKVVDATLATRLGAFFIFGAILVSIPEHLRFEYSYRNDPDIVRSLHVRSQQRH
jgi:hypothetical protein